MPRVICLIPCGIVCFAIDAAMWVVDAICENHGGRLSPIVRCKYTLGGGVKARVAADGLGAEVEDGT